MRLDEVIGLFRRRWIPVLVCLIAGVAGAALISSASPRVYQANARLFVNIPAARGVQEALQGVQLSSGLLESYAKIATSQAATERISEQLDEKFTPAEIRSSINARPTTGTLLITIDATDTDPSGARDIANAGAAVLVELIGEFEPTAGDAVAARVVDSAVAPRAPIRPRPAVDLTFGLLLGAIAGVALAIGLESLDKSITTSAQAAGIFNVPTLVQVPARRRRQAEHLAALDGPHEPASEAFRALRTAVRFLQSATPVRTLLVTSPNAGEGKSTVAANLAVAFAQAGERVVLVDADLRRSSLPELLQVPRAPGLTEVLRGEIGLEAIQQWRDGMEVLTSGELPSNPSELLGSEAMAALLGRLVDRADIVIIDTSPLLPVTDSTVLAAMTDATLVVVRWAQTDLDAADEANFTLDSVGAPKVGVVINGVRGGHRSTYYRRPVPPVDRSGR